MIFGRKKQATPVDIDDLEDELVVDEADDAEDEDDDAVELASGSLSAKQVKAMDAKDWREEGPFDISEVDLDADEVERIDMGALVATPFDGLSLQLQVDEEQKSVRAMLVTHDSSGLEVALFAAPRSSSMLAEVRKDMTADALRNGGKAGIVEGPFGIELRRVVPVKSPDGQQMVHASRTWLVQGPGWLLRGVLMGKAAQESGTEGATLEFYEFFANLVVRRGNDPYAAGELMTLDLPAGAVQR